MASGIGSSTARSWKPRKVSCREPGPPSPARVAEVENVMLYGQVADWGLPGGQLTDTDIAFMCLGHLQGDWG